MIRKLQNGKFRLYPRKKDPKTGKRRNLGTFGTKPRLKPTKKPSSTSNTIDAGI